MMYDRPGYSTVPFESDNRKLAGHGPLIGRHLGIYNKLEQAFWLKKIWLSALKKLVHLLHSVCLSVWTSTSQ